MSENKKKSKLSHMGNDVYEVERILNHRFINQRSEYLVKWAGYSNAHNSWEPEANIYDESLIADYEEQFVKRYREKSSSSDNDDYEVDDRGHRDKSKKSKLIKTKKYPSYREDIKHSSKISSKKGKRMLENSLDEERREFPSTSSTGRSSIKSHKDKDHHRKHKHRSEHDKHHLKSSKLLKVSSEERLQSSIVNKKKKNKHKKRKHHEHGDIPADSNVEQVQRDGQPAKMNFQRKTFKEFFESVKGNPKMCTPVTCNGTTFIITEYI